MKRVTDPGHWILLLLLLAGGCKQTAEPAQPVAAPPATPAVAAPASPPTTVKGQAGSPGDQPPPLPRPAVPPRGLDEAANLQANIEITERQHGAGTRVNIKGEIGGPGSALQVNIETREDTQVVPAARPIPAAPPSCKSALLAAGHAPAALVHCEGVNQACAVALLQAGHGPAQLVHCGDVKDVDCALQLLRSGRAPAQIVHCN